MGKAQPLRTLSSACPQNYSSLYLSTSTTNRPFAYGEQLTLPPHRGPATMSNSGETPIRAKSRNISQQFGIYRCFACREWLGSQLLTSYNIRFGCRDCYKVKSHKGFSQHQLSQSQTLRIGPRETSRGKIVLRDVALTAESPKGHYGMGHLSELPRTSKSRSSDLVSGWCSTL
jgi:hypothetical protein